MNILLICKLANHTLTENVLLPLFRSQSVEYIYVLRDEPSDTVNGRVIYMCPKMSSKGKIRHLRKIWLGIQIVKKYQIGAIIGVLNTPHGYIGRTIGILTQTPYIHMTIAGHREFWIDGKLMEKWNLWFIGNSTAITVSGSKTREYLENKGIQKDKIFILPNLPNEAYTKVPVQERRDYDIVSFSRIDKNKNLILLVKALSRIKYKAKVAIAGDGEEMENVKAAAMEYGVSPQMEFLGYISSFEDKVKLLSNSKIFISCSKGEGFPVSLLEAMNCGCVPVVSNVGDIADVIRPGQNGYLYEDTDDEGEFVECLENLLFNEKKLADMRTEAVKIKETISVSANGEIWNTVLDYVSRK